jgi:hypothetical protein
VKGETYLCPIILLPLQNPRSPGTSPLGLASLKRKNLPIVVTLGGIGSCYASLAFYLIAFTPSYKLCDNKRADAHKTTLITNRGTLSYKCLFFGLLDTSTTFKRPMHMNLDELFSLHLYLDDLIVYVKGLIITSEF